MTTHVQAPDRLQFGSIILTDDIGDVSSNILLEPSCIQNHVCLHLATVLECNAVCYDFLDFGSRLDLDLDEGYTASALSEYNSNASRLTHLAS